jgi:hypothetical protein
MPYSPYTGYTDMTVTLMELKYFVLKPKGRSDFARASRTAMRVLAAEIEQSNPKLATEVKQWAYEEERKAHVEEVNENRQAARTN